MSSKNIVFLRELLVSYFKNPPAPRGQKAKQGQPALRLLQRLETLGTPVRPNAFTYTSTIVALADEGKWRQALDTYDAMPADVPGCASEYVETELLAR